MTGVQNFEVIEGGRATAPVDRRGRAAAAGALFLLGVGLATVASRRRRRARDADATAQRSDLGDYLREHLSGSDLAIHVVERLRHAHEGADDRVLFARLLDEFQEEREVLRGLIADLGESPKSVKRLAGRAAGFIAETVAGAPLDDGLTLFRTLEALAIGVQGKRCLWRALQALDPPLRAPGYRNFAELESMAVGQWETIEQRRSTLAAETFTWRPRDADA
jgi:hypothetical protein